MNLLPPVLSGFLDKMSTGRLGKDVIKQPEHQSISSTMHYFVFNLKRFGHNFSFNSMRKCVQTFEWYWIYQHIVSYFNSVYNQLNFFQLYLLVMSLSLSLTGSVCDNQGALPGSAPKTSETQSKNFNTEIRTTSIHHYRKSPGITTVIWAP